MSGISERNPFVGPRPIQQGEPLYGRSIEIRELYNRLQARRIVVLHSPSGAGKSSLVHAGLMPRLRENHFDVWKPIRVNLDPAGLADVPPGTNRYLLSALVSLEEELPAERRRAPAQLAGLDLLDYLAGRPRRKGSADRSVVLLFDQFEEVLTTAPRAVAEKRAFFDAVGRALDTGHYWALFIVREDYLAALAPYRDRIPTQLANTFRLDLLGLAGAKEAAEQPALKAGRTFPAVEQLVADLSMVKVQQADGSFVSEPGLYVEPVLLQVTCRRLWAAMPDDDPSIEAEDIAKYAEVSSALAGYYAEAVAKVAGGDPAVERAARDWVGSRLIVGGIRSQVRQEAGRSAGLDNLVIERLLGSYLVRVEQRAGANWFELSHDRLVEPVQNDNRIWEEAHLHPMQVQAKLWESARRAGGLLLSAEGLEGAAAWMARSASLVTDSEREFLQQSQHRRREEVRLRRFVLITGGVVIALLVGIVAALSYVRAQEARAAAASLRLEAAEAGTARLRAEAAETEQKRLQRSLKDFLARNPTMASDVATLREKNRLLRWEILKLREANQRTEHEIVAFNAWTANIDRDAARLRDVLRLGELDRQRVEKLVAAARGAKEAAAARNRGLQARLEERLATNGELRGRLLAAGLLPSPLKRFEAMVAPDRDWDGVPDWTDGVPEPPPLSDAELEALRNRVKYLEDENRLLKLLGDELRVENQRLEKEQSEVQSRRATLARELAEARRKQAEADAQRGAVLIQIDQSRRQIAELRTTERQLAGEIGILGVNAQSLEREIKAVEFENEEMRRVLAKRAAPAVKSATPASPAAKPASGSTGRP